MNFNVDRRNIYEKAYCVKLELIEKFYGGKEDSCSDIGTSLKPWANERKVGRYIELTCVCGIVKTNWIRYCWTFNYYVLQV